jgi:tetratricopeptide (TPR) repeat protein
MGRAGRLGLVVPRQLPPPVRNFAGRLAECQALTALVQEGAEPGATVVISAVSGTAGVGKTALAVHWAHQAAGSFPDGQLYVNLRGFDPDEQIMPPGEAVRGFLEALGVPAERIPSSLAAQSGLYRSLIAGKRILVVLDNARDAEQVRALLPATATAVALVTSRSQLASLVAADGANLLTLDLLTPDEARELLTRRLGSDRVGAEPQAVRKIISACARLPLALSIAAARALQSGFSLDALAAELGMASQRLDALDAGDITTQVRAVFSWSYQILSPPAATLFRLLGLHPGPDISTQATASLAGQPVAETRRLLAELTRAHLLAESKPGRYSFHDLLRSYAADLTRTHDPDDRRWAARIRLLDHYTHTAQAADKLLNPGRDPIPVPLARAARGTRPEHPADHRQAIAWLATEHHVLLAVLRHAADAGLGAHTWQLAWALNTYLYRQGRWHDLAGAWQAALHVAGHLGDAATQAFVHRELAQSHTFLDQYRDAHIHYQRALDLYTEAGDRAGQAHTLRHLGYLWERQGQLERALGYSQQALALFQTTNHTYGRASALNSVGWQHALLGDHAQALSHCRQALTVFQQLNDRYGQAATWDSLGYACHQAGSHARAAECYQHALTLFRDLGDSYDEAIILTHLGGTNRAAGDLNAARAAWSQALHILTDLNDPDAEQVRINLAALSQAGHLSAPVAGRTWGG